MNMLRHLVGNGAEQDNLRLTGKNMLACKVLIWLMS